MSDIAAKLKKIKLLALDVDGVLTDGSIIINSDGSETKVFNVVDGHRISLWHRAGFESAIISGRFCEPTDIRAKQLNIKHVLQDCKFKLPAFESLLKEADLEPDEAAYIGDDLMDIPVVKRAGFGVAVSTACRELKKSCDYVTNKQPGKGAVGEVVELLLKANGKWSELMERYLV
jgi:3-deoxy-D-manno-octulosonate 8-phosphate phosphatase (KDO 8-P phosphatase)